MQLRCRGPYLVQCRRPLETGQRYRRELIETWRIARCGSASFVERDGKVEPAAIQQDGVGGGTGWDGMGRDGMGWDGIGDGTEWGMRWDGKEWGMGRDEESMRWDELGWDGTG